MHFQAHHLLSLCEGQVGFSIAEVTVADHVAADFRVQNRCLSIQCSFDTNHSRQEVVLHFDRIQGILSLCSRIRHHHGQGFTNIANAVHGQAPVLHGSLNAHHEGLRPSPDIVGREHRSDTRQLQCWVDVHAADQRVCVGRSQDRRVNRSGLRSQVVRVGALAAQQGGVFQALHGASDMTSGLARLRVSAFRQQRGYHAGQCWLPAPCNVNRMVRSVTPESGHDPNRPAIWARIRENPRL